MSEDPARINPDYPLGQLLKALSAGGERAPERARQWRQVLSGLLDGTLHIGSRTPVEGTPAWVTLEVVHGGFATGNLAAGGPLQPHEVQRLHSLPRLAQGTDRGTLNLFFLSDLGRPELKAMLADGRFRIHVPEEGALLIVTWLLERGEALRAAGLLEAILPLFDRLRFYPVPHARPAHTATGVHVWTVRESVAVLRATRPQAQVARMNEALQVWTPLGDRAVALFLETIEGEPPFLRTTESGELERGPSGQPLVAGGWPCRRYPDGWADRARQLLDEYTKARARHTLCGKPERPKENFARLRGYLAACAENPAALTGREVGMIRKILASSVSRHGAPGSERLLHTRMGQAAMVARPPHHIVAGVLADRLGAYAEDEGIPELAALLGPLTADEAAHISAAGGEPLPPSAIARAMRCLEAPLDALITEGLVGSSEVLAGVLPLLTARIRAAAIADTQLGRVYEAVYRAFRRRRSLLLLDLESQVRLEELPWIAAVEPWVGSDMAAREAARATLVQAVTLAVEAFPQTILPNKLVKELQALATGAGLALPLVEELAADIFMGAFAEKFLRAAQTAARVLQGSLYARYYSIPVDALVRLDDVERRRHGATISPGFAHLCEERARADGGRWSVARNGTIIEQAEILTTHNLAVLFDGLTLVEELRLHLPLLAHRCFQWICHQQLGTGDRRVQLQMVKNMAYAWRQMLFFLSLANEAETAAFLDWAIACLQGQREEFSRRFRPALLGLAAIASGGEFDAEGFHAPSGGRRFLGWTVDRHWLLDTENRGNTASPEIHSVS
jgi:hypothetical protein